MPTHEKVEVESIRLTPIQTGVLLSLSYRTSGDYDSAEWAFGSWDEAIEWLRDFVDEE